MRIPKDAVIVKSIQLFTYFTAQTCVRCDHRFKREDGVALMSDVSLSYPSKEDIEDGIKVRFFTTPTSQMLCELCSNEVLTEARILSGPASPGVPESLQISQRGLKLAVLKLNEEMIEKMQRENETKSSLLKTGSTLSKI